VDPPHYDRPYFDPDVLFWFLAVVVTVVLSAAFIAFIRQQASRRRWVRCPTCGRARAIITGDLVDIQATCAHCDQVFVSDALPGRPDDLGPPDGEEPLVPTNTPVDPAPTQRTTDTHPPDPGRAAPPPESEKQDTPPPALSTGTLVDQRYEILAPLGEGAMGSVYRVRHTGLNSTHALKLLDPDLARHADIRNRFLAEGQIQAQVKHPNIVQVTDIVTDPLPGLVMEYVEGPSLGSYMANREAPLSGAEQAAILLPVLEAVESAHQAGIVHRDLKPDNLLIGRDGKGQLRPVVTDFGIAKVLDETSVATGKKKTETGMRLGTLMYMAPEQIRGLPDVDHRADIFALGAILYELVTGTAAFDAPSEFDTMRNIVDGTYEPPERRVDDLDPVLAACIRKALSPDPAARFPSCELFRQTLQAGLTG